MADFNKAYERMLKLEFSSASDALHKNKNEKGLTFMGIYEGAHPSWRSWKTIKDILRACKDMKEASRLLYNDLATKADVKEFYLKEFWQRMRLDEIIGQKIAEEIFVFGVNANHKPAVKLAQRIVGVKDDGIMGEQTIRALNLYNEVKFDKEYDEAEKAFYDKIIKLHPELDVNQRGWYRRAEAV
ncbi:MULTISPECIES: glycosyl hydrolase 108 family protein [Campylobacter]|uniref:glycosyl hydrolase 108 family protein n=1 Tax=Campylobacter TaxID=194 RepID=UPI00027A3661|nr:MULTISPECIES: glycosyl hydrolase 108 family protein [Campylobacter]EJP75903.1 peptidoglycan domain protein [Campylobacter sp. FOBRC14]